MLFSPEQSVGFFVGLAEDGLNFGAELIFNYDVRYQSRAMLGMFVIIELERPEEAILARITAISSHGRLASTAGEDMGARSVSHQTRITEDIKEQFLRYRCSVRLLGMIRETAPNQFIFTPSHRRLPHLGAKVSFADGEVLQMVAGARRVGSPVGFLAFGEFIYATGHPYARSFSNHFILESPAVQPNFDTTSMVARRSAMLARSGFGKSNLMKILFSQLYVTQPTIPGRDGNEVPVGTLIFDPDGDYFWPGNGPNAPPGLCDIPELSDSIVLATDRSAPAPYYGMFQTTSAKLDLRGIPAGLVLSCALPAERLHQRGTEYMSRLSQDRWDQLVDAAWLDQHSAPGTLSVQLIQTLCRLQGNQAETIALGIRSTMLDIVNKLHNPDSLLIPTVIQALTDGKLMIVDLSLMRGQPSTALAAILLKHIFEHNVREHTKADGRSIPVIALIEEAQKVLEGSSPAHTPFIDWVKEGRKYGLGAVLVTQQPGAIPDEILSQTDNFFVFHLISGGDLTALKRANGHFSEDILASLLNEPIEGQGVFWSSAGDKTTYPIPFRAFNFGDMHSRLDSTTTGGNPGNYAARLKASLQRQRRPAPTREGLEAVLPQTSPTAGLQFPDDSQIKNADREMARNASGTLTQLNNQEFPLFIVEQWLKNSQHRQRGVQKLAITIVTCLFGLYGYGWELYSRTSSGGRRYLQVKKLNVEDGLARLQAGEHPLVPETDENEGGIDIDEGQDDIFA